MVVVHVRGRRRHRDRVDVRPAACASIVRDLLAPVVDRDVQSGLGRVLAGDGRRGPQRRPARGRADARSPRSTSRCGTSRRGMLGLPAAPAARRSPRRGAGVRQRRVHHLRRPDPGRAARRLGRRSRHPPRSRSRSGRPWGTGTARDLRPRSGGPRGRRRPASSCSSTPTAATPRKQAIRVGRRPARPRGALVRGAGLLRRPAPACVRSATPSEPTWPPASTATTSPTSQRMCGAGAVDCLQADVSRCGGITEWLRVAGRRRRARPGDVRALRPAPARGRRGRRPRTCVTWSGSTTTSGSSRWLFDGHRGPPTGCRAHPIRGAPDTVCSCGARSMPAFRVA